MSKPKINRRKDGLVEKKVKVPDGKGGFKRKSIYNRDPVALDIEVTEIKDQVNKGIFLPKSDLTFEQVARKWFGAIPEGRSPTTKKGYGIYMEKAINLRGNKEIQSFLPVDIQEMYNEFMLEPGKKGKTKIKRTTNTLKHLHFVVNSIFKFAIKNKVLRDNPCDDIGRTIKPDEFVSYIYDKSEYIALLKIINDTEVKVIAALAGGAGLRAGEICGLQLADIDDTENTISIKRSRYRVKGTVGNKKPKSKRSTRIIPVDPYVISIIATHVKTRKAKSDYVLCRLTGNAYISEEISSKFQDALEKYNLPHTRLHDLRHFYATELARLGVDIKTASELLGDDPQTVLKIYQHVRPDMKKSAAVKFGSIFDSIRCDSQPNVVKSVVNKRKEQDSFTTSISSNPTLN
jgi:integrase